MKLIQGVQFNGLLHNPSISEPYFCGSFRHFSRINRTVYIARRMSVICKGQAVGISI